MAFTFAELARRSASCSASVAGAMAEAVAEADAASACMPAPHAGELAAVCIEEVRTCSQQSSVGDLALSFLRSHSMRFFN